MQEIESLRQSNDQLEMEVKNLNNMISELQESNEQALASQNNVMSVMG